MSPKCLNILRKYHEMTLNWNFLQRKKYKLCKNYAFLNLKSLNLSLKLINLDGLYRKYSCPSLSFNTACTSIANISECLSSRGWKNHGFRQIWLENDPERWRKLTSANYISCKRKKINIPVSFIHYFIIRIF